MAIALHRFASSDLMESIGEAFGVSKQTVSDIVMRFIFSLIRRGRRRHLSWPIGERLQAVKEGFSEAHGFFNCCGAIDVTYIPIELPPGMNSKAYHDWKNGTSICVQAIVDSDMRFLDILAGWPGSIHDGHLLKQCGFFKDVHHRKTRLAGPNMLTRNGSELNEYIIGDGGYGLRPWLMSPFKMTTDGRHKEYNYMLSSTRMVVERLLAISKVFGEFLSEKIIIHLIRFFGPMIYAPCILHNILIDENDVQDPTIWEEFVQPHNEEEIVHIEDDQGVSEKRIACRIRNILMEELIPLEEWTRSAPIRMAAQREQELERANRRARHT